MNIPPVDPPTPLPVKVLIVTMFQDVARLGEPNSGEAERWVTRDRLERRIAVPGLAAPVCCDEAGDECLIVTGMGLPNAAAAMMAVGLSGRFDLTRAYVLIAGVAGVPPAIGTLGTAAWAEWVVNGGQANLADARELPPDWAYPYFHLGCAAPWCATGYTEGTEVFHLNPALTATAYRLSKDVPLADSAIAQENRSHYNEPAARAVPTVIRGDSFSSDTFCHGRILSDYAAWWMRQWSGGQATYAMANNEDAGTLTALRLLVDAGRLDWQRVMVLRTASDFDQPYPGQTTVESVAAGMQNGLPLAFEPALDNAYRVGSAVVREILESWDAWRDGPVSHPADPGAG